MNLLARLLLLPLAPVEGVVWVARQIEAEAERQYFGPEAVQRQLEALSASLDAGEITEDEFVAEEDALLEELDALRAREGEPL